MMTAFQQLEHKTYFLVMAKVAPTSLELGEEGSCVTEIGVDVLATSMMTEKVGAVATNWAAAVPDSARVTVFVLDVVDVVVTVIVFAALSPDAHVRDAGL